MQIRDEQPADKQAIFRLTTAAFESMAYSDGSEPVIIDALRENGDLTLSLVAVDGGEVVGHIAFSPVTINGVTDRWFGLGPVSVEPEKQNGGIGSKLVRQGLDWLKSHGANGCVLVGDPNYYGRFGFMSDGNLAYGDVPGKFVQWLSFDGKPPAGVIKFSPAFDT
ncbi:MAG: N-acetyltransferase [Hyphomicrobiales bacterium]|nr:N-acetyltransferase [Hyphomicrobiales bacterium]